MITALDVANTFIHQAKKEKIDMTPMKLQKLIYILYKVYLQKNELRLFNDRFEVWQYGPVISSVYEAFKQFRSANITDYYRSGNGSYNTVQFRRNFRFDHAFEFVWETYKRFDGGYLSQLTHQPGTAWAKADEREDAFLDDQEIYEEREYRGCFY